MRRFVQVTDVSGEKSWVNLDTIREIIPPDKHGHTKIVYLVSPSYLYVQETPEQMLSGVTVQIPRDSGVDIDEILTPKKEK